MRPIHYFENEEFLDFCTANGLDSDDEDSWAEYLLAEEDRFTNPHA